jgi:cobyrinic acid a,c-diamide synthase
MTNRAGDSNNRVRGRGLILAAPASGSGKTLVTAGLLRHLREGGWRVAAAKAGPDYIDPTFHAAASGGICLNLDLWAMRPATLAGLVGALEIAADIVLCEGVMGLFDGTGPDGETGSTAALARVTGWPVVLVVDARHQGASAAALVAGFAQHDPELPLAGVVFNRVAGPRHRAVLEAAMARHLPELPCLGAVPQDPELILPERHLGLVPAGEQAAAEAIIARAARAVAAGLDIDRLVALARPAVLAGAAPAAPLPPLGARIAVARDDAFLFAYPAVLEGWRRQGAELSFFSPLADEIPDPAADAVYLPGGYPELHAGRLAAASRFVAGLRRAATAGMAIYGECGGYMVLGEALADAEGGVHRMAGLLPLATSFAERRLHLGYRAATLLGASPLGPAGARFRGHEFHYATTICAGGAAAEKLFALADASGSDLGASGLRQGSVAGSFIHLIDRAED